MAILLLLLTGLFVVSLTVLELSSNPSTNKIWFEIHKLSIAGLFFYFIIGLINVNKPSAMDVYQGKTILRKTYEGGKAIDSMVVFKKGIKNGKDN